jgi:hypothetical protein
MKRSIIIRYVLILALGLVIPVMMGNTEFEFMSMKYLRHSALQGILYTILYWEGNLFLFKLMKKRFPDPAQTKKKNLYPCAAGNCLLNSGLGYRDPFNRTYPIF